MYYDSFNNYRNTFSNKPLTAEEARIKGLILQDQAIVRAIGSRLLTNESHKDDLLGAMLMASSFAREV
jgi:hypothetical protein